MGFEKHLCIVVVDLVLLMLLLSNLLVWVMGWLFWLDKVAVWPRMMMLGWDYPRWRWSVSG